MRFILLALVLSTAITGCKTTDNYTLLSERYVDNTYDTKRIKWRGTFRDAISVYYVKLIDEDGKLGVCASRVSERTGDALHWYY